MSSSQLLSNKFEIFIFISAITESRNGTYCHKTGEGGDGETGIAGLYLVKFPDGLRCAAVAGKSLFVFLLMSVGVSSKS